MVIKKGMDPYNGNAIEPVGSQVGRYQPSPPGTKIVAFANFKGGVGKTTCSLNVAACLAYQFNKKVLLVDLDVQASLSQWLMGPQQWHNWTRYQTRTSYQIFVDVIMGCHAWSLHNSTVAPIEACPGLRLCPATFDMLDLDTRLHNSLTKPSQPRAFQCLDVMLKPVCGEFDYVILDCPPNMYLTTQNALFCADHVIIPTQPDFLATAGLKRLVGFLKDFREQFLLTDPDPVRIAGIFFNMYDKTKRATMERVIGDVESYIEENKFANKVFLSNARVFDQRVRGLASVTHAQERRLPVSVAYPHSEASKDFIQLTHQIREVLGDRDRATGRSIRGFQESGCFGASLPTIRRREQTRTLDQVVR